MTKKTNGFFAKFWRALKSACKRAAVVLLRVAFFTVLLAAVICACAWFLFVKYVNEDALAALAAEKISQTFNRPVLIGQVKMRFINSVQIDYLEITGGKSARSFARTGKVNISFNPFALLNKEILIEEIVIEDPKIFIVKDEAGNTNLPQLAARKAAAPAAQPFKLTVRDWTIKRGLITYSDLTQNKSHTIYDVNTAFDNLDFNALSAFKASFMYRNVYKDNVFDTLFKADGRVNMAGFNKEKFALRSVNLDVMFFKEPLKINVDIDNLNTPFISFTARTPQIKGEDLSLFFNAPKGLVLPPMVINANALFTKNYRALDVMKLSAAAGDINLSSTGVVNMEAAPYAGFTFKTDFFALDSKELNYAPLAKFNLKGAAAVESGFTYKENKFTLNEININLKNAYAKAGNFFIENLTVAGTITKWYSDMAAVVQSGALRLGGTHFTDVNGTVVYRNNTLKANVKSAKVNGNPIKLTTDIFNFNSKRRRQINSKLYFQTFDPMVVVDIVYDFVYAITNKKTFKPRHTGSMAWLKNFRDGLPGFMPNFKGIITADNFTSAVASGTDFEAEFDLKGLTAPMKNLDGHIDAQMTAGTIYNLEKKAEEEKVLGVAFQPFIVMHRMERAGSFKVGTVLRDVPYNIAAVSVDFLNSNMNIVNAYVDGSALGVLAKGRVDWYNENLDLVLWTIFRNTSRAGALAENLTDVSGAPALSFSVLRSFERPEVHMLNPRRTNEEITKAKTQGLRTAFTEGEKYRAKK